MSKPRLVGNKAHIEGNAYDLKKTLSALHRLVCAYMDAAGVTDAKVSARFEGVPAAALPKPGIELSEKVWRNMAGEYDVVDEPLLYTVGKVTFKAYLLGKTWSEYLVATGEIVTSSGEAADQLGNAPVICVYGEQNPDGSSGLLSPAEMDQVEEVLECLGLDPYFERSNVDKQGLLPVHAKTQVGFLTLPHDIYGAGRKELVVRCVLPGGKEITKAVTSKVN